MKAMGYATFAAALSAALSLACTPEPVAEPEGEPAREPLVVEAPFSLTPSEDEDGVFVLENRMSTASITMFVHGTSDEGRYTVAVDEVPPNRVYEFQQKWGDGMISPAIMFPTHDDCVPPPPREEYFGPLAAQISPELGAGEAVAAMKDILSTSPAAICRVPPGGGTFAATEALDCGPREIGEDCETDEQCCGLCCPDTATCQVGCFQ